MISLHKLCKRSLRARFLTGGLLIFLPLLISSVVSFSLFLNAKTHMDSMVDKVSHELTIVHELQKKLLWAPMPANDYLLHGDIGERQQFEQQAQEIADTFHFVRDGQHLSKKVKTIVREAEMIWHDVKQRSRFILKLPHPVELVKASVLMETLDAYLLKVVSVLDTAQTQVHSDIALHQNELNETYQQAIIISVSLVLIGLMVSAGVAAMLMYSIYKPIAALKKGAAEFYTGNLQYRIEVDYQDDLGDLTETFNDLAEQLSEREQLLQDQASMDELTGLYNRREFDYRFKQALNIAKRKSMPLSLLLIDIDYFKQINDSYGHQAGDAVLRNIAACLREAVRPGDVLARIGGEEFVVLIDELGEEQAMDVAERIRINIHDDETIFDGHSLKVTTSIGIARFPEQGVTEEDLISVADKMLYRAKKNGRDKVCQAA